MSSIKDLLNPLPEERPRPTAREKRARMPKDAPLFRPGPPRGEVRYPPFETSNEKLLQQHREFQLHPMGRIAEFPRHIPYQSDKKSFQEKTGRDSFNVFQYTFKIPGEDTVWTVLWDYNIGLVRTTHLFKCNGHSKTAPGKVLNANSGLREICHSITGGSLAAQGYWMPYEAAKAVAATFCWKVRHVLTPLFGPDFPDMCIQPKNGSQATLGQILIEPDIVDRATKTAHFYRSLEIQKDNSPLTPESEAESYTRAPHRQLFSKIARRSYADSICSARGSSSEPSYCNSPQSPGASSFTPINTRTSYPVQTVPSPEEFVENCALAREAQAQARLSRRQRERRIGSESELDISSESSATRSPGFIDGPLEDADGDKAMRERDSTDMRSSTSSSEEGFESDDSAEMSDDDTDKDYPGPMGPKALARSGKKRGGDQRRGKKYPVRSLKNDAGREREWGSGLGYFAHEVKAAHALLHLHMQEADGGIGEPLKESVWSPTLGMSGLASDRKRRHASM